MHFDKLYPGRFIKAGDFNGKDVTLTVTAVKVEKIEGSKKVLNAIFTFAEMPKEMDVNKTNGVCVRAMFGNETNAWVGKRITFYPEKNTTGVGESDVMIRVRGSPDIEKDITFTWTPPRKSPQTFTMRKTGGAPAAKSTPPKGPPPNTQHFDALMALAKLNQVPPEKAKAWLKTERNRTQPSAVTPEDVEAYKAALAAEAGPPPEDAPF